MLSQKRNYLCLGSNCSWFLSPPVSNSLSASSAQVVSDTVNVAVDKCTPGSNQGSCNLWGSWMQCLGNNCKLLSRLFWISHALFGDLSHWKWSEMAPKTGNCFEFIFCSWWASRRIDHPSANFHYPTRILPLTLIVTYTFQQEGGVCPELDRISHTCNFLHHACTKRTVSQPALLYHTTRK